ncbi:WD40-repeat-containing domain protein [Coemansia spiralis]|nr:WD40-repeat-containing domain protein [Coemansia spiralis]
MAPKILHKLDQHIGSVNAGVFDSTGEYIFTGGQDKTIQLCNARSGRLVQSYDGHGWAIQDLAVSEDSSRLASCGGDRSVFLWDVDTAQVSRKFTQHQQRIDCVAINDSASVVVSGSFDKTVMVWDARSSQRTPLQILKDSRDGVSSVCLTGAEIVAGSLDGAVRTYDIRMGRVLVDELGCPVVSVKSIASTVYTDQQTKCLLIGCMDGSIQLFDSCTAVSLAAFSGHKCKEYKIRCDANGKMIASGSEDNFVYLWDILQDGESGKSSFRLPGHSGIVNNVALNPCSSTDDSKRYSMVSTAADGSVIIWE